MSKVIKVTAIIGIISLASFYVVKPQYDIYQVKKVLSAPIIFGQSILPKINTLIEQKGYFPSTTEIAESGINSRNSQLIAYISSTGDNQMVDGEIKLVLTNTDIAPELLSQKIIFVKDEEGNWQCTLTIAAKYRPDNCALTPPPQPVYAG